MSFFWGNYRQWFVVTTFFFFFATAVLAELTIASPFTDHGVLQRDQTVPVWGTADAGVAITVKFAGQSHRVKADGKGKWKVTLTPMPANSRGQSLKVKGPRGEMIEVKDLLIGEVWICSGQSNMKMEINRAPKVEALVPQIKNVRSFEVKRTVAFAEQNRLEGKWVEEPPNSAVACSFAFYLEDLGEVPVGIILASWGSSSLEAWMPRSLTEVSPHFKTMMEEFDADTETRERIEAILQKKSWGNQDDIFLRRQSNILYNAMIHPLIPYACRGVVWYQGERNTQSMNGMVEQPWYGRHSGMLKYGETLQHWMRCYRERWQQEEFHFLVVMLPGYYKAVRTGPREGAAHPASHSWAWMRESQLKALELPDTGVVNTIDLGDVKNIHPKDKLPIGYRLALLAADDVLGKEIASRGPQLDKVVRREGSLVVTWKNGNGLKTTDGKAPSEFWITDESKKWFRAEAKIEAERVVLSSKQVKAPLYVRYAFVGKPEVNLVNGAELPAYPFRTDSFVP